MKKQSTRRIIAALVALSMTLPSFPLTGLGALTASAAETESSASTSETPVSQPTSTVSDVTEEDLAPSEGLEFVSNGDGTCYVSGLGSCTDTDVVIPSTSPEGDKVVEIGGSAFYHCISLTSITIPDGVAEIEGGAFSHCDSLTSVTLPDGLLRIGDYAFYWCYSLTSITIPASVTEIGKVAFSWCYNIESITVAEGNTVYHSEGNCLIETASKTLIAGCQNSVIPADGSVTEIGGSAFRGHSGFFDIYIPECVTDIGQSAFYWCSNIGEIVIANAECTIGENAFHSNVTIYGYPNSTAQAYAEQNGNTFTALDSRDAMTEISLDEVKTVEITEMPGSVFFSFTPEKDGRYVFESVVDSSSGVTPCGIIRDGEYVWLASNSWFDGNDFSVKYLIHNGSQIAENDDNEGVNLQCR